MKKTVEKINETWSMKTVEKINERKKEFNLKNNTGNFELGAVTPNVRGWNWLIKIHRVDK